MQIAPPPHRYCHTGTKKEHSVAFKIRFRPGLSPGPHLWGTHDAPPETLWSTGEGHSSPYRTPLGTDPPSVLAMRPPRIPARFKPMVTRQLHALAFIKFHVVKCLQTAIKLSTVLCANNMVHCQCRSDSNRTEHPCFKSYLLPKISQKFIKTFKSNSAENWTSHGKQCKRCHHLQQTTC